MSQFLEINNYHLDIENFDGKLPVLKNINITIQAGETVGIVGESGSGKSTIVRLILRLLPPRSGTILFDGQDIARLDSKKLRQKRKHMQLVFQNRIQP